MTGNPLHEKTVGEVVAARAALAPERTALEFEGASLTYAGLDRLANRFARALLSQGLGKGDHIAWLGKNSHLFFAALLGASRVGIILTPVNWRLAGPEIAYILDDAEAKLLFVGREFTDSVDDLRRGLKHTDAFIAYESEAPGYLSIADFLSGAPDTPPYASTNEQDVVVQLYTSGTTGHPKGAMLHHHALIDLKRAGEGHSEWNSWSADDISLVAMPCFHVGGTVWGLTTLMSGAKAVIAREFVVGDILDYMERDGISKIFLVPAAIQFILRDPRVREVDYSRIKYMLYGASPIPLDLLREAMDVFGCGFVQMYGMTETAGTVVALPPEDHDVDGNPRMRSAGKAMPGVEVAIMGEDGTLLPPGETGEIVTRSSANMKGYWNLPDATASTLAAEGWLKTGDAGRMDNDGYVYILDRVKDMIITGGENVYPAEVENAVFSHPDVADVGVIGVPDARWGEAVKAVVVRKPGAALTESDVIDFARTRIAGFKAPKSVDFVEELPRNPSGKILRRELRAPYWEGRARGVN